MGATLMEVVALGKSHSSSLKRSWRPSMLAVLDQCVFSGTNFVTAILIGRISGAAELGVYALCFSLTMICIATQRAFLISPFVVVSATLETSQLREMRGAILMATLAMTCALALISIVAFFLVSPIIAIAMVVTLPSGLLRDFHRRLSIAQLRLMSAFQFDLAIAVCQVAALGYAAWIGKLSATSALFICSFVWVVVSGITFLWTRDHYRFVPSRLKHHLGLLWPIGRWVGLSQLVSTMQAFSLPWLMAGAGSLKLAGIYLACWNIVQVTSPIIEGLGNLLGPALARRAQGKSLDAMKQRARIATVVFSAVMLGLVFVVAMFGRQILQFFYGDSFVDAYQILLLLTIASAVLTVGIPSSKALTQVGKSNWNFTLTSASLLITLAVAAVCLDLLGSSGAAFGLLAGAIVSTVVRWILLQRRYQHLSMNYNDAGLFRLDLVPPKESLHESRR